MTRRSVTRQRAAAALAVAAVLAVAGCGSEAGPTAVDDPAPASAAGGGISGSSGPSDSADSSTDPSHDTPRPQWPSIGCDSRSVVAVDYGRMATGWKTPQEAVEHGPVGDLPAGVLTLAPSEADDAAKGPAQVWVVDPDTNEIQAQVSVFRGPDGWFVDGVMTCS
jgi:hypothetical protein